MCFVLAWHQLFYFMLYKDWRKNVVISIGDFWPHKLDVKVNRFCLNVGLHIQRR